MRGMVTVFRVTRASRALSRAGLTLGDRVLVEKGRPPRLMRDMEPSVVESMRDHVEFIGSGSTEGRVRVLVEALEQIMDLFDEADARSIPRGRPYSLNLLGARVVGIANKAYAEIGHVTAKEESV